MPYWKLYYHFIWGTKNRLPLIDAAFESELYRAIVAKAKGIGCFIHAIGGIEEHVHLAVSIPPKIAPAKFIGDVKGNSSHFVNHVIKPDFEFYWQDEYGVCRGMNPTATRTKPAKAALPGLVRFTELRTNSTVVFHRAGMRVRAPICKRFANTRFQIIL